MIKADLRKLRTLKATKEMMQKGKRYREEVETRWWNNTKRVKKIPEYDILARGQCLGAYIKIALFLPEDMSKGIDTPRYEVYLNTEGGEYITRELDEEGNEKRWLTSMIHNLEGVDIGRYYYSDGKHREYVTSDLCHTINNLKLESGTQVKGLERVSRWQQAQKDAETLRKEAKEQEPWDKDMELIPKLAAGFEEWMRKDVTEQNFIIYEYEKKGTKEGYCSRCQKTVKIKNPHHNKETSCPRCHAKALFKAAGKINALVTTYVYAEIIQKIEGGIVIRQFSQHQWYRGCNYRTPNRATHELERTLIMNDGTMKHYEWGMYKNKYHRWVLEKGWTPRRTYYWSARIKVYPKNIKSVKETKILKESAFDLWGTLPKNLTSYIACEQGNPAIEKLARIGMFKLAKEIMDALYDKDLMDQEATELHKMLKIDKARLQRLKSMDGNLTHLKWMQFEKKANTIFPDQIIKEFGDNGIEEDDFEFVDDLTVVKIYNYMKKQMEITGDTMRQVLRTWEDYLDMAEKQKMNTELSQIQRPKNLKLAHDELVIISEKGGIEKKAKELRKKFKKVDKICKNLEKYEYQNGKYEIRAPKGIEDIVLEGTILRHCIHTCDIYFDRIQSQESFLVFLRKEESPDMPWYTLEIEPGGNIRQKRTTGDKQDKDLEEATQFLKKWQKEVQKRLTEEDKKLAEASDKARKENYALIREQKKQVWHGVLAGKLLADVLEEDFMEVI